MLANAVVAKRFGSVRSRERGASMVIVVVALLSLMGAAALAIDIGSAWSQRRDLITATDAAALAAAADYINNAPDLNSGAIGCAGTDDYYLAQNAPNAAIVDCQVAGNQTTGVVAVSATQLQEAYFGSALGLADFDVPSFTAASWGPISAGTGLRPFGLCAANPAGGPVPQWLTDLRAFVDNPPAPPATTTITINYGLDAQTDPCGLDAGGNGAGNWGTVNLRRPVVCAPSWDPDHPCPSGNPGNNILSGWTAKGYDRPIQAGTKDSNCVAEAEHCWYGDTGADMNSNGVKSALNNLVATGEDITLPLIDSAEGNGNNLKYHIFALVQVRVVDYCFASNNCPATTPPPPACSGPQCDWFLTLEFKQSIGTGLCCDTSGNSDNTTIGVRLCAVDPTDISGC